MRISGPLAGLAPHCPRLRIENRRVTSSPPLRTGLARLLTVIHGAGGFSEDRRQIAASPRSAFRFGR